MWDDLTHRTKYWLRYQKAAQSNLYIHSPFVFSFYNEILGASDTAVLAEIENLQTIYSSDKSPIEINDQGAKPGVYTKRVDVLAKEAATSPKFGRLLHHWLQTQPNYYVLELGTSLGFGTAYMGSAKTDLSITTIDAADSVLKYAQTIHQKLGLQNIEYIHGTFDDVLPITLNEMPRLDFAFIDGNHTEVATLRYFELLKQKANEHTVIVLDDIYWSKGMTTAWERIKADKDVSLTIDLYRQGWVFFRKENLAKEDFVLRY